MLVAGSPARVLFPLLGLLLIALGMILLVAHNWDQLDRTLRLTLAFTPLLCGQLACLWTGWRARDVLLWREASAACTVLAFAAALALVGQIYHFPGDLDRFLLSSVLVTLPLVYALNAALAASLCALALAAWAWAVPGPGPSVFAVAGAFALLLPLVWRRLRQPTPEPGTAWLLWVSVPALFVAVLAALPLLPRLGLWWLALFGAILTLLPNSALGAASQRPALQPLGAAAVVVAALIGSFPDVWHGTPWTLWPEQLPLALTFLALGMALLAVLAWRAFQRGAVDLLLWPLPPLLMALVTLTDSQPRMLAAALLLNAWLLLAGTVLIRGGLRDQDAARATRGLLLIALLVLLRFIDSQWSFTLRGIAFVLTGAAFVAAHLWLRHRVRP